jgi:hypothetical protein
MQDPPEQCGNCGIQFWLLPQNVENSPEYCPFCGAKRDYYKAAGGVK